MNYKDKFYIEIAQSLRLIAENLQVSLMYCETGEPTTIADVLLYINDKNKG